MTITCRLGGPKLEIPLRIVSLFLLETSVQSTQVCGWSSRVDGRLTGNLPGRNSKLKGRLLMYIIVIIQCLNATLTLFCYGPWIIFEIFITRDDTVISFLTQTRQGVTSRSGVMSRRTSLILKLFFNNRLIYIR